MDTYLTTNLRAVRAAIGPFQDLPDEPSRQIVTPIEGGRGTSLVLLRASGEQVVVHSRRDPLAEARRQVDEALKSPAIPPLVVLVGAGLGYLVDVIEERSPTTRIVILEPEPLCVRPLLSRRDFSGLLSTGRLLLLWGPDYHGWTEGWRFWDPPPSEVLTIAHPVLSRLLPGSVGEARSLVERMVFGARSNAQARARFAAPYLLNTLRNLPVICGSRDVRDLFESARGVPAVLVAAGPSLDRSLDDLATVQDRAVVVAVDTALRPLLHAGIEPDFVVAVDLQEVNARSIAGLGSGIRTSLVAEGSLDATGFAGYEGRTFTFRVAAHHPWPWLIAQGLDRGMLRAWGSVLTTALDLVLKMGCDPLVFVGADLAYTGGQPYCRNTHYEAAWAEAMADGTPLEDVWRRWMPESPVWLRGITGADTATAAPLIAFRDWLVRQSEAYADRRFVNATGGGILEGGRFLVQPLVSALRGSRRVSKAARSDTAPKTAGQLEGIMGRLKGRVVGGEGDRPDEWLSLADARELVAVAAPPTASTTPQDAYGLSEVDRADWPHDKAPHALHVPGKAGASLITTEELDFLERRIPLRSRVLEVGTFTGTTTATLADRRPDSRFIGLDAYVDVQMKDGEAIRLESYRNIQYALTNYRVRTSANWNLFVGNAAELRAWVGEGFFDVVFVDADHEYDKVKCDLATGYALLKPGGQLLVHDYSEAWPGVQQAVAELMSETSLRIETVVGSLVAFALKDDRSPAADASRP